MRHEEFLRLIDQIDRLVEAIDEQPEAVQTHFTDLLRAVDRLHREALVRLTTHLRGTGGGDALDQAAADPIVRTLLGLYGLAELDLPPEEPEALADDTGASATSSTVGFFPAHRLTVRRRSGTAAGTAPPR